MFLRISARPRQHLPNGTSEFIIVLSSRGGAAGISMPQAYCVKCKTSVEIKNPMNVTLKNGKPAVSEVSPNCGTKVFRIGRVQHLRLPPVFTLVLLRSPLIIY